MIRSRFQIGPGGMLYLVVAALILSASIYTQANLLFWSFGLMVGGLVVSVLLSAMAMRKVRVTRVLPAHGVAGEPLVVRYRIDNGKRWLPVFNLVIREQWGRGGRGWRKTGPVAAGQLGGRPVGWALHVGPGQSIQAEAMCWPRRRGELAFERIEISTSFPFGVVRRAMHVTEAGGVLVYPRLFRMQRRLLFQLSQADAYGGGRTTRTGGHEDFFGLRPYRSGDSLKTIDWKRSARTGELISREYSRPSPPRLMILLDLRERDGGREARGRARTGRLVERMRGEPETVSPRTSERDSEPETVSPRTSERDSEPETVSPRTGENATARQSDRNAQRESGGSNDSYGSTLPQPLPEREGGRKGPTLPEREGGRKRPTLAGREDGELAGRGDDELVERAISLAASLVCDAYLFGYQVGLAAAGVKCEAFAPHHSLPHRARLLEALSRLDASATTEDSPALPASPSVTIRLDGSPGGRGQRGAVITAADMQRYVREAEGGSAELLAEVGAAVSRRRMIEHDAMATLDDEEERKSAD